MHKFSVFCMYRVIFSLFFSCLQKMLSKRKDRTAGSPAVLSFVYFYLSNHYKHIAFHNALSCLTAHFRYRTRKF